MSDPLYVGSCPICQGYGMLEIVVNTENNNCSVMCDECSVEWKTPENARNNIDAHREFNQGTS